MDGDFIEVPLYKLWKGSNRFAVRGRLRWGPRSDCGYNLCLWMTVLVPTVFYLVLPAPVVWKEVSPAIVIVTSSLALVCLILFLLTTFSDPGYIPRKEIQVLLGIQDDIRSILGIPSSNLVSEERAFYSSISNGLELESELDDRILLTDDLVAQGYKYCETCRIIRPPRASHCSDCSNCCLRHDHHCPFVSNCVGHRNYVFFTSFITATCILGLMVLFSVILWMGKGNSSLGGDSLIVRVIGFAVGIPTGLLLLAGFSFLGYHLFLLCTGKTTREHIRGRNRPQGDPLTRPLAHSSILSSSFFSRPPRLYPLLSTVVRVPHRIAV